jgi:hypothetical protein
MTSCASRLLALVAVVAVAACCAAFEVAFAPGLFNATDTTLDIRLHAGDRENHFTLKPHTGSVSGRPNNFFSALAIRFPSGKSLTFDAASLRKMRRDAHVASDREFWIIRSDSIELLDGRDRKRADLR